MAQLSRDGDPINCADLIGAGFAILGGLGAFSCHGIEQQTGVVSRASGRQRSPKPLPSRAGGSVSTAEFD